MEIEFNLSNVRSLRYNYQETSNVLDNIKEKIVTAAKNGESKFETEIFDENLLTVIIDFFVGLGFSVSYNFPSAKYINITIHW